MVYRVALRVALFSHTVVIRVRGTTCVCLSAPCVLLSISPVAENSTFPFVVPYYSAKGRSNYAHANTTMTTEPQQ
jgi:hypothetical protein